MSFIVVFSTPFLAKSCRATSMNLSRVFSTIDRGIGLLNLNSEKVGFPYYGCVQFCTSSNFVSKFNNKFPFYPNFTTILINFVNELSPSQYAAWCCSTTFSSDHTIEIVPASIGIHGAGANS